MNIIILGDKYQKRMKSKGCVGLIKLNKSNILSYQYKICKTKFPQSKIIYVYGFDNKRFSSYIDKNTELYDDIVFVHNKRFEEYNTSYSLSLVKDYLNSETIIFFGDHVLDKSIFNRFRLTDCSQAFVNTKNKSRLGCVINDNSIENISYDLDNYLSEVYFISKSQIATLKQLINNPANHNYFLFELINKMIDLNQHIIPYYI